MKIILLTVSLIIISASSFGQWDNYDLNFDGGNGIEQLTIDTISNPNNIWQVGAPQKTLFTSAYSSPNVIVTDTIHSYPINDTSFFLITNIADGQGFEEPQTVIFSGEYFVNSDSLSDYGTIEFSPDNGNTWIDLIYSSYSVIIDWQMPKPILTGNSYGWKSFHVNLANLGTEFNIHDGDTVIYRITFISDSVQSFKDGLMFDNFHFEDWAEEIVELQNDNLISIYPNPVREQLYISTDQVRTTPVIQILNLQGQLLYDNLNFTENFIDIQQLKNGMYFLKYSDNKVFSIKKFVVIH